jgi:8-oxo-dGTP pyrophosphatase MutT (NUDIX family)
MKKATLCLLLRDNELCLAMKKRGFGVNKYNGFGGKVGDKEEFKNESIEEALMREGQEEFGITIQGFERRAEMLFTFPSKPEWDQVVYIFICRKWKGDPQESEEMKPEWFKLDKIPYEKMWDDDKYWLPRILKGEVITAEFQFSDNGKVMHHEIRSVGRKIERK